MQLHFQQCLFFVNIIFKVLPVLSVKKQLPATSSIVTHVTHQRSGSVFGETVYLENGAYLFFNLCFRQTTSVLVSDVHYSNDGGPNVVSLSIDKNEIGSFRTGNISDWGRLWNIFKHSGPLGSRLVFYEGWHGLHLFVSGNAIEIDYVEVELSDETITRDILSCSLKCSKFTPNAPSSNYHGLKATMLQKSYPTKCAEEDNVKLPVYLKNIASYRITATLPHYNTYINERYPNISGCPNLPSVYWKISNLILPQTLRRSKYKDIIVDYLFGYSHPRISQVFQIRFHLKGRSLGYIDADIGSIVTVKLHPVDSTVTMQILYRRRNQTLVSLKEKVFRPGVYLKHWNVPDFSWNEFEENALFVVVTSSKQLASLTIDYIELERRFMRRDRVFTISDMGHILIEGVDVDFWWRSPETMAIRRTDNGEVFPKVDYFRISINIPSTTAYAQIFVLYQDGNVRLLQLPPNGLDWVPFGTSVIVGPSDPDDLRPAASVYRVDIHPYTLNMTLYYNNGGSSHLQLNSSLKETILSVSQLSFKSSIAQYPFMTFRSMYIKDGNSDADSVFVDGTDVHEVMRNWISLTGRSFMLFRRCESRHLTLSPDIRLDVEQTTKKSEKFNTWLAYSEWKKLMGF